MKIFILTCSLFLYACTNKPPEAKLIDVKQLSANHLEKNPISLDVPAIAGAYQWSCKPENNVLSIWKDKGFVNVNSALKPSSKTSHYLDGQFMAASSTDEGCDIVSCGPAETTIYFDLTDYEKIGEKPNPDYKVGAAHPKDVPEYKSKLLSGRFKVMYSYYTDSKCTEPAIQELQFETN